MTSYNDWYIRADQAWTMYHDLLDEQSELVDYDFAEVIRNEELSLEIKEWKEAAEYAEKQMEELENLMSIITTVVTHNIIINESTQPTDGFQVKLIEEDTQEVLETFKYDYSWEVDDAIQDALSGV